MKYTRAQECNMMSFFVATTPHANSAAIQAINAQHAAAGGMYPGMAQVAAGGGTLAASLAAASIAGLPPSSTGLAIPSMSMASLAQHGIAVSPLSGKFILLPITRKHKLNNYSKILRNVS